LDRIPAVMTADDANSRAQREAMRPLLDAVGAAVVSIDFGDGRHGLGTIISREGEILTAGHLAIGPDREAQVTLADGRNMKAKTRGVSREQDLGLLKIEEPGEYSFLRLGEAGDLPHDVPFFAAGASRPEEHEPVRPELYAAQIRRIFRGSVWIDTELDASLTGGPLTDGRLLGVHYRRSRFGGFLFSRVTGEGAPLDRMRRGDVWGDWQPGTGPVLALDGTSTLQGLQVTAIERGSSAASAGLKPDDVVGRCEGKSLVSFDDLDKILEDRNAGDEVTLEVIRGEEKLERRVRLSPRLP
jgi:serine protease Do